MRLAVTLLLLAAFLSSCSKEPLYQSQSYVFGTLVDISIYGEPEDRAQKLAADIQQDFQRIHHQFHAWHPDSELSNLNQAFAAGKPITISAELAGMIGDADQWSEKSGELFNPAIGRLVRAWGFQRDEFAPVKVDETAIATLVKANPRMKDISIHENIATSRNPSVQLDMGGYAKGYALDRALAYLKQQGVRHALINIGGNIIALGKHGEHPWRIGIQHPRKPGPIATLDLLDGWAIGTSGDYQRYFELDGIRYCHIIDPRSGYPAQGTQAVTVLIPPGDKAGVMSDAASKPVFIAGLHGARRTIEAMGVQDVMMIDAKGNIFLTAGMAKRIHWVEQNVAPKII